MRTFNLITLILAFFSLNFAAAFAADNSKELNDYTSIQALLAKDTFQGVPETAKQLALDAKANHHPEVAEKADKLAQTTDIKNARDVFAPLSKDILPLAKADHTKTYEVVYCPMKKARWVQKSGPVANPYYGSAMQDCGVKDKE